MALPERKILSVTELTKDIKLVLENAIGSIWVDGEASNLRQPASGHLYFTLKDANAQIRCVLFRHQAQYLKFALKDGMAILVFARVSVYERDGSYQLYVDLIEPKGKGSLQLAFEQLKVKLSQEGLFDPAHKKLLPFLPITIGIITSPTGAVIRDMLHVLDKRFDAHQVILFPVKVQGAGAKEEIVEALEYFNATNAADVLIVARGGGSIEDLWVFNEEAVVRAVYASAIPVISAVGHETDFTLIDFVADMRAPTPSRAAELVIPQKADLLNRIHDAVDALNRGLRDVIPQYRQRIDDTVEHLTRGVETLCNERRNSFERMLGQLQTLNPLRTLGRGYSITTILPANKILSDGAAINPGDKIRTQLNKGNLISVVESKE